MPSARVASLREDAISQADIALVQSLYAAFGRGDIATIIAALAPDVDWRGTGNHQDYPAFGAWKGPSGVQDFFRLVAEHETFAEFSPQEFHAADGKVFVLGRYAFTVKKTGRPVASDWVHVFTIRGGKVTVFREFNDTAQVVAAYRG